MQQQLIDLFGRSLDDSLKLKYPFLLPILACSSAQVNFAQDEVETYPKNDSSEIMSQSQWSVTQQTLSEQLSNNQVKLIERVPKTKTIAKVNRITQNITCDFYEQSEFKIIKTIKRKPKDRRKRGTKPQGYPTKNFLACFKTPHISHLQMMLGEDYVNSFEQVRAIKKKSGISMYDYVTLYKITQFHDAFVNFFADKKLYRSLLLSRSLQEVKKIHHRKLQAFQEAFLTKVFEKIN